MAAKVSWLWNYVTVTLCISTSDKPKYGPTKVLWLIYLGTGIRAPPKWFLGLTEFTSQTAYRLVQPCCRVHQCVPHTDTQAYGAWNIGNNTNNTSVSHVAWVQCCLLWVTVTGRGRWQASKTPFINKTVKESDNRSTFGDVTGSRMNFFVELVDNWAGVFVPSYRILIIIYLIN